MESTVAGVKRIVTGMNKKVIAVIVGVALLLLIMVFCLGGSLGSNRVARINYQLQDKVSKIEQELEIVYAEKKDLVDRLELKEREILQLQEKTSKMEPELASQSTEKKELADKLDLKEKEFIQLQEKVSKTEQELISQGVEKKALVDKLELKEKENLLLQEKAKQAARREKPTLSVEQPAEGPPADTKMIHRHWRKEGDKSVMFEQIPCTGEGCKDPWHLTNKTSGQ